MTRPRLLDLFCCAGGASEGYRRAGFDVVGVDIAPQPHYPFEFHQADAMTYSLDGFDAIHASPPCQAFTEAGKQWRIAGKVYPDLVAPTRAMLQASGRPWVIENVPGAPLLNPTILNGSMFGLRVRRVRWFETSFDMPFFLLPKEEPSGFRMGRPVTEGGIITPVGHFSNVAYARRVMDLPWMTQGELAQSIPPAFTEFMGGFLLAEVA